MPRKQPRALLILESVKVRNKHTLLPINFTIWCWNSLIKGKSELEISSRKKEIGPDKPYHRIQVDNSSSTSRVKSKVRNTHTILLSRERFI